jgi:type I restriction enzyme S subunit
MNASGLRFKDDNGRDFPDWEEKKVKNVLERYSQSVDVYPESFYQEIGIRSHGKGIFHKQPLPGYKLGNKRVFWVKEEALVFNIVFAWEQAVAKVTHKEKGMIASHRFPMYIAKEGLVSVDFVLEFFLTKTGKILLSLASPGGAGRNKTLGQKEFENMKIKLPVLKEQTKVANFLTTVDEKITQLTKKCDLLAQYKNGVMQHIFSQQLRFKDDAGRDFPDWEEIHLGRVLKEHKTRNLKNDVKEVFSVAKNKGVINQIEHLGRSYASKETSNYKVVFQNDVIYTKSPTSNFPLGIIKQNKLERTGIVSVLYGVFTPTNKELGLLLDYYFFNWKNTYNYLNPLAKKGAKNTINVSNDDFLNGVAINLPSSIKEQIKITNFLTAIDEKITHTQTQLKAVKQYKQGLLQQLFV